MAETTFRTLFLLLSVAFVLLHSGCAATQGYTGAPLPPSEVATVYFYSENRLDLSQMRVGSATQGIFDMGITVRPESYPFSADYTMPGTDCTSLAASLYGCFDVTYKGTCSGTIRTSAGREYSIRVTGVSGNGYISVTDKNSGESAGSGSCEITHRSFSAPKNTPPRYRY